MPDNIVTMHQLISSPSMKLKFETKYSANLTSTNLATIAIAIRENRVETDSTTLSNIFSDAENNIYSDRDIRTLAASDVINMILTSTEVATV